MKTFLAVIGALALVCIVLFASFVFIGFRRAGPIMDQAQEYAAESLLAVVTDWNAEELWARGAPEFRDSVTEAQVEQMISNAAVQFGAYQSSTEPACSLNQYTFSTSDGDFAVAQCAGEAEFEKVSASYLLNLVKRGDDWKLLGFFLTPTETKDAPVTVSFNSTGAFHPDRIVMSVRTLSIGVAAKGTPAAGAHIGLEEKVENVD